MRSFTFCIVHHEERQGSDRAIWSLESVWRTDAPRSYHSPFSSTSLLGYFTKQQQGWNSKWYSAGYHLRWRYQQNLCRGLGCTSLHLKYQGKQGSFQPEERFELSSELGKDVALVAEVCLSEARQTRSVMDSAAPTLWVMWWNTWSVIGLAPPPYIKGTKLSADTGHGSNHCNDSLHSKILNMFLRSHGPLSESEHCIGMSGNLTTVVWLWFGYASQSALC